MIAKLVLVALIATLPWSAASGASDRPSAMDAVAWTSIDAAARAELEDKQLPSLVVAIAGRDGILWSRAYGFEDAANTRPATLDSIYRVGAITDALTGLLVRELATTGRLDLDRPVTAYLADFKPANPFGGVITLRTLLAHASGLVREPPVGSSFATDEPSLAATVRSLNGTTLVAAPGTTVKYSNADLAVAARTLEVVAGEDYDDLVPSHLLSPLGMRASALRRSRVKTPVYAEMAPFDSTRFAAPVFDFGARPAGGLYTSARDLVQLARMLIGRTHGKGAALPGFQPAKVGNRQTLECTGQVYGFSSDMLIVPGEGLAVIVLGALDGSPAPRRLARYATTVLAAAQGAQPVPMWPRSSVYGARAREAAGVFRHGRDSLVMRVIGGRLYLEGPTVAAEVRRTADGMVLDDNGTYSGDLQVSADFNRVVLSGDSYDRLTASEPSPPSQTIQHIVGDYGWPHAYIRVYERDGRAYARMTWSSYQPLTAAGTALWALPTRDGPYRLETIRFQRDARGRTNAANLSGVVLPRREFGAEAAAVLRESMRPIATLRAAALAAQPPVESGSKRAAELVELTPRMAGIRLDIRYATSNNFLQTPVYTQARAFLQRPAAEALRLVAADLAPKGFGLTIHDAYRPWFVTKMFWDATPEDNRIFVADPSQGSRHNRGAAVDLTLHRLKSGDIVTMPGGYDEMSSRSFPLYVGGTSLQRWRRDLLREAMEARGFTVYEAEWWHFDFNGWQDSPISNVEFSAIGR
jgi:D-alanyl-D-alanine dipeptidase/CubicO group peptidase (beta-lactamase class C family)